MRRGIIALVNATFLPQSALAGRLGGNALLDLDHVGIAVRSIAVARVFYEALGLKLSSVEEIEHEGVRTAMMSMGSTRLELLEPLRAESVVGRFLDRRGEGLHHVAVRVDDIDARFSRFKADGMRLASATVRTGAGGHRYFFVHPASTGGVLIEIVGRVLPSGVD